MKYFVFIFFSLFSTVFSFAQSRQVTNSSITFKIKNLGIATSGSFSGLVATINFDKDHLNTSSIEASVDTKTINSDNTMRDNHLKDEEYFDVEKYPEIKLKSVSFTRKNNENFIGVFNLTIKDKTKPVKIPFSYIENNTGSIFKGSFDINRLDFGVGGKSMVLANEATVLIEVETTK
ncbi:YceI family protein [Mucilaginibacter arboris]|uniref:YceI family protein n=1 Tax=Mucilaginibacter arboris TaxID=2682090 RepID=A0A7K1SZT9_9SPHI|nr:YceI family protein [Mucilaginibacter arboris]MVN22831.1 YceI family protein [Mucilaginibacter arboris]